MLFPVKLLAAESSKIPQYEAEQNEEPQYQEPEDEELENEGWLEDFLQKIGADGKFNSDKAIDFSVLPGPFYNPEM
ncbi:MAG: hypothetical protein V7782_09190, partial [Psychromonas sp.]